MDNLSGQQIKGYELKERIAAGGFGAVYRAQQSTIGREVAIKIILPGFANQPDFIRRFEAEAQLIARLEHHFIVPLYDYWRDANGAYLVMRYLRGGSLQDHILKHGALSLEDSFTLFSQVAQGLHTAHRNQVIHRDIKPGNILLDEDGTGFLADFGIAKDHNTSAGITDPDAFIGSPEYLAPEQARSEAVTPQTDIYSLGVILYEMLTGEHPFPGIDNKIGYILKHLDEPLPEIDCLEDNIRDDINALIQKASAKDPGQRFRDVLEMLEAFREAAQLESMLTPTSPVELLTPREQEVVQLILDGKPNREIAEILVLTEGTVKTYITRIYRKLRVRSRVQLIAKMRDLDFLIKKPEMNQSPGITQHLPEPENPYKGLQAFQAADAPDFFGRDALIQKLLKRLQEEVENKRFLAVVGASGSGKSSVVKAGLIPALWRGEIPCPENWYIVDMLPGERPLDELEVALTRVVADAKVNLREQLSRDSHGLLRVAEMILPDDGSELLLVIDQFEEVFTLVDDDATRLHFLQLLQEAVSSKRSRVRVIVTLRADYYDKPLQYPHFAELMRSRAEIALPPGAEELEQMIREPAKRVAVHFEDGLVSQIVSDVHYQPGALPLLQYALTELFERREGRVLTMQAYLQIGGTGGALANRADELYHEGTEKHQELIQQMFLRLVTLGEGAADTRRRVARSELLDITSDSETMSDIIDAYAGSRLLSLDIDPASRKPTVEVAHEAILGQWERLRNWINQNREGIKMQQQLSRMAGEWENADRDPGYLARGLRLDHMLDWAEHNKLPLTDREQAFLDASLHDRQQRKQMEKARKEREITLEQQSVQRLRWLVAVFVIATAISVILAAIALDQRQIAIERANENHSLYLTNEARIASLDANPLLALSLSIEAFRADSSSYQAYQTLDAMSNQSLAIRRFEGHTDDVTTIAYSPDGTMAISGSLDTTLILWDISTGAIIHRFTEHTDAINDVAFSPDGTTIVSASSDNTLIIRDVRDGDIIRVFEGHHGSVQSVSYSPDGNTILSGGCSVATTVCTTGQIILQNARSGETISTMLAHSSFVSSVAFNAEGQQVVTASIEDVMLWQLTENGLELQNSMFTSERGFRDLRFNLNSTMTLATLADGSFVAQLLSGSGIIRLTNDDRFVDAATISPDVQTVVFAEGRIASLIDLEAKAELMQFIGHDDTIQTLVFSPSGETFLSGSSDNTLILWQAGDQAIRTFSGHRESVAALAISPDSTRILGGGATSVNNMHPGIDYSIIAWDIATGERLYQTEPSEVGVVDIAVSPDGRYFVSTLAENVAGVWDLASGELLNRFEGLPSRQFDISPDGRTVLSAGHGTGHPVLWDIATGQILLTASDIPQSFKGLAEFSVDGTYAITAYRNNLVLWDVETGHEIRRINLQMTPTLIALSPDGEFLIASNVDGNNFLNPLVLVNINTGESSFLPVYEIEDSNVVHYTNGDIAFSPDGQYLLQAFDIGRIVLWDLRTFSPVLVGTHERFVQDVDFTPDGIPVSASDDGTVKLWGVGQEHILEWVEANRYVRDFTCQEREIYRLEPLCSGE